jgi:UDP-N-acetylmuramoyl-tripeptide--D-alanyl-D-alanine ligase
MSTNSFIEKLHQYFINARQKICIDTRKLQSGSLFFALKGNNFNANEFAHKAVENGCSYAIVDEEKYLTSDKIILVNNTLKTLQQLANHHRQQYNIPVLAITGSNGKTTHKELINAVLSKKYTTLATEGNLNNHIGVPLTLLRITSQHQFAIIEMGANHQGEIEELCNIANPNFGLITNIGKAHLEGFGGEEGVKKGKSEMYKFLKVNGSKIFINGDDDVLNQLAISNDKITYGCKLIYDTIGKDFTNSQTVSFKFTERYGEKDWSKLPLINTQITGGYNFINCLAAVCVGHYFKVEDELIAKSLVSYVPQMNRSQLLNTGNNTLILDAYNANPNSMKVAIENFSNYMAENKLAILGDMFELGEYSVEEHKKIIELVIEKKLNTTIFVGNEFFKLNPNNYTVFKTVEECKEYLKILSLKNHTLLIKGSRSMKMENLIDVL